MRTSDRTTTQLHDAIGALERLRAAKLQELKAIERAIRQVADTMLVDLPEKAPRSLEYRGVGIVDAAKHWIRQTGKPQLTRAIAEALVSRGITTRSRNFVSTVYATLAHSDEFQRTHDGRWMMRLPPEHERDKSPDASE